jgi:DNA primase
VGRISEEDIRRVRDTTDLVGLVSERVVLKQKGRLYWGCCPFHAEKTPSFKVDPATQLWHCFGCGLGGDAFGYVMRIENLEFADAVRGLAERAHIEIHEEEGGAPSGQRNRLMAACEAAAEYYHAQLVRGGGAGAAEARAYLSGRGFGSDVAKRFRLGYAPGRDHRCEPRPSRHER